MDFVRYFIEPNVPFGGISTAMALIWAVTLGIGIYLLRSYRDNNPIRTRFLQRVGLIEAILGGVGLVLLLLKLIGVDVLEWRLWGWLVALAWLGYTAYAIYAYTTRLPVQIATTRPMRTGRPQSGRGNARTYAVSGNSAADSTAKPPREPRPIATTKRREARREKKRKSR